MEKNVNALGKTRGRILTLQRRPVSFICALLEPILTPSPSFHLNFSQENRESAASQRSQSHLLLWDVRKEERAEKRPAVSTLQRKKLRPRKAITQIPALRSGPQLLSRQDFRFRASGPFIPPLVLPFHLHRPQAHVEMKA